MRNDRPMPLRRGLCIGLVALVLAACGGPVKRVSEPAASIQQLTARADGNWDLALRINNFSSVGMRFTGVRMDLAFDNGQAARLELQPGLDIGPESADVVNAVIVPTAGGRARLATALADGRGLTYELSGTLDAQPETGSRHSWEVRRSSALSPVPGLPGALR